MNAVKMWTMEEYCRLGDEAEKQKGEPKLGVKKKPSSVNPIFDLAKLIFVEKFLVDLAIK